eukprot:gene24218-29912_t
MGLIDIQEFIATVRGEIPSQRLAMLDAVFIRLVDDIGDGKGSVGISALQNRFNGAEHPLVALGGYSEQYAVEHMLKCLEIPTTRRPPSKINRLMFQDYYGDLSATIDDDERWGSRVVGGGALAAHEVRDGRKRRPYIARRLERAGATLWWVCCLVGRFHICLYTTT